MQWIGSSSSAVFLPFLTPSFSTVLSVVLCRVMPLSFYKLITSIYFSDFSLDHKTTDNHFFKCLLSTHERSFLISHRWYKRITSGSVSSGTLWSSGFVYSLQINLFRRWHFLCLSAFWTACQTVIKMILHLSIDSCQWMPLCIQTQSSPGFSCRQPVFSITLQCKLLHFLQGCFSGKSLQVHI